MCSNKRQQIQQSVLRPQCDKNGSSRPPHFIIFPHSTFGALSCCSVLFVFFRPVSLCPAFLSCSSSTFLILLDKMPKLNCAKQCEDGKMAANKCKQWNNIVHISHFAPFIVRMWDGVNIQRFIVVNHHRNCFVDLDVLRILCCASACAPPLPSIHRLDRILSLFSFDDCQFHDKQISLSFQFNGPHFEEIYLRLIRAFSSFYLSCFGCSMLSLPHPWLSLCLSPFYIPIFGFWHF